jgi:hypothetical protein
MAETDFIAGFFANVAKQGSSRANRSAVRLDDFRLSSDILKNNREFFSTCHLVSTGQTSRSAGGIFRSAVKNCVLGATSCNGW